jgi:hypothetical protein
VLAVRDEVLKPRAAQVKAAVDGHFATLARYRADPAALAPLLASRLQLPPEQVSQAFRGLDLPTRSTNRSLLAADGEVARGLPALTALLQEKGLIGRSALDTSDLLDPRWVQEGT